MKRILIFSLILLASVTVAQSQRLQFKPNEKPIVAPVLSDEEQIQQMLFDLVYGIRNNQIIRAIRPFAENVNLKTRAKGKSFRLMPLLFQLDSLTIEVANDRAFVRCQLNDGWKLKANKELLTLKRTDGYWRIEESGLLIDLLADHFFTYGMNRGTGGVNSTEQEQIGNDKQEAESSRLTKQPSSPAQSASAATTQTVSSLLMSSKAVVRRLVPYTDQWSITKTTTEQHLQQSLFVNPVDGEVVRPNGTSDYVAVIVDKDWNRIVYGSFNGGWVDSYGDKSGHYRFRSPLSIDVDAQGAIYCVEGATKKVLKLQYNASTQQINFVSQVSIQGLINPVDVDIDNNGTPTNSTDDSFWVADKDANAILRVSPNGQILGKATSAIDVLTNEVIQFSGPTKALVYFAYNRYISIIDLNKRRVTIISSPTFQGTTISGYVRSAEFATQTNVQLESLGRDLSDFGAVWAVDKNNGLLHTFDDAAYSQVYLASIDLNQWNTPVAIASTKVSGGSVNTYDLLTLDVWNNATGINAYLPGADFLNPYKEFVDVWGTTVGATFPTASRVKVDLYRSDGSFIKTQWNNFLMTASRGGFTVLPENVGNPLGKYRARFEVTPLSNSSYGQYQQSPTIGDVWFSMPLKASLSGPSSVVHPMKPNVNQYTWTCNVTSGAPTFSYVWKKNGYTVGSNSPTFTEYFSFNGYGGGSGQYTLSVTVTDQSNPVQTKTVSKTITEYNSGGDPEFSVAENEDAEPIPDTYALSQNYPNPFNPETEIHFALPEPASVRLSILDILGREIAILEDRKLSAGYKSVRWNGKSAKSEAVSSGMYFYRLVATGESGKNFVETKKMLMTK